MPAAKKDLYIEQGATFEFSLIWTDESETPKNLTGFQGRMQIREKIEAADPALISLTSSPAAGISIVGAEGRVNVVISDEQTATLSIKRGVYDLEVEGADGRVYRLLQGSVIVDPNVTR